DALGGVVHYHSIDPAFSDSSTFKLSTSLKHATAAQENSAHVHVQYLGKKFTSLSSFSYADFGDLKMGTNRAHGDDEWGLVNDFVVPVNGVDEQRVNSDPNIQKNSGYHQYDLAQKLKFKLSDKAVLKFNGQYSTTSDIPRFDRYNDYRDGVLREAEWYYGPQQRVLLSGSLDLKPNRKWSDKTTITAAYQRIDEDRITRRFGSANRFTREEDVKVYSLNADMVKGFSDDKKLFYGLEITSNDVVSSAFVEDIFTGDTAPGLTRYPNGGSTFNTAAGYISYLNPFHEKWQYNVGLRYNIIESESTFNTNEFFELPFDQVTLSNSALTGSAGLKYNHDENLSLRLLTSSGFRAPNIDDYGKVFDRDGFVVVPDDRLTPEYALNGESGFTKRFFDKKFEVDASFFYTQILDAIVQRDFLLNGNDSLSLEGEVSRIQSNQNASEARIYGYSVGLEYEFNDEWTFNTFLNYTFGEVIEDKEPLAHIPPFFAKAELSYEKKDLSAGLYVHYHDVKSKSRMASGRTDNPNEGLNGYFPAWHTINARVAYDITKSLTVQLAAENILDTHYKAFASGLSAPGRNFIFVLRANI
ncbi:MAG: hemoglobin/transferrin/lactoferrin receptor protein, partial [Patiriisocius sp.]